MSDVPTGIVDSRNTVLMLWVDKDGMAHANASCDHKWAADALRRIADMWDPPAPATPEAQQ